MNETRGEYLKRINFVLDFIEKNLDADLSLELLSQKAHYSPYHFHRVFSICIGENLNKYINRKRVERIASILLTGTKKTIKELAYLYGFNSESSFSRTFKKYYGISPTQFKSEGKIILSKIGIEPFLSEKYICSIDNLKKWLAMNAQIVVKELPEIKLAGIMHIGEFAKMGNLYQRLMEWGSRKKVLPSSAFKAITIYHDNPNVTQLSRVRYSACITINKDIDAEGEIRPLSIAKGIYVVGQFEIEAKDIAKAWKSTNLWVIENGYEFRDGDFFEIYHNDASTHPAQKNILDICIPIEWNDKLELEKSNQVSSLEGLSDSRKRETAMDYHALIAYMKELRSFFHTEYDTYFKLGTIYQGHADFSYFSLSPAALKKLKLKFVIILDHKKPCFTICLSGQNKSIRRKYWEMFKGSNWNKYHLAESIDDSLSIIDQLIVENPNFNDRETLTAQIEQEALKFIKEIERVFE